MDAFGSPQMGVEKPWPVEKTKLRRSWSLEHTTCNEMELPKPIALPIPVQPSLGTILYSRSRDRQIGKMNP